MARDGPDDSEYGTARERLVERLSRRASLDDRVLAAMRAVPRHEFVPVDRRERAYQDRPLPIGADQTISAPHIVAAMADHLDLSSGESVLEVGTGCGYHAAVTAEIVGAEHVYSVEYEPELADRARETLDGLGYGDVSIRTGDGYNGWPEHAPYDAAYLTCAAPSFPPPAVEQVRTGGRLLGPVGEFAQELVLAEKRPNGLERERHGGVRFVRMRGDSARD